MTCKSLSVVLATVAVVGAIAMYLMNDDDIGNDLDLDLDLEAMPDTDPEPVPVPAPVTDLDDAKSVSQDNMDCKGDW